MGVFKAFRRHHPSNQSPLLFKSQLTPCVRRFDIMMAESAQGTTEHSNIPRRRAQRFSKEEVQVLVHEVKERERAIFGTSSLPPSMPVMRQAWEEVRAAVCAASGVSRSVDQIKKRFADLRRQGKRKVCINIPMAAPHKYFPIVLNRHPK